MTQLITGERTGTIKLPYKVSRLPALTIAIGHVMLLAILVMMISQTIFAICESNLWHLWKAPMLFGAVFLFLRISWYSDGVVTRIQFDEEKLSITFRFGGFYRIKKKFYKNDQFKINGCEGKRPESIRPLLRDSPQPNRYVLVIENALFNRYPMICDSNKGWSIIKTLRQWKNS